MHLGAGIKRINLIVRIFLRLSGQFSREALDNLVQVNSVLPQNMLFTVLDRRMLIRSLLGIFVR